MASILTQLQSTSIRINLTSSNRQLRSLLSSLSYLSCVGKAAHLSLSHIKAPPTSPGRSLRKLQDRHIVVCQKNNWALGMFALGKPRRRSPPYAPEGGYAYGKNAKLFKNTLTGYSQYPQAIRKGGWGCSSKWSYWVDRLRGYKKNRTITQARFYNYIYGTHAFLPNLTLHIGFGARCLSYDVLRYRVVDA